MNWFHQLKLAANGMQAVQAIEQILGTGQRGSGGLLDNITTIKGLPEMRQLANKPNVYQQCYMLFRTIDTSVNKMNENLQPKSKDYANGSRMANIASTTFQRLMGILHGGGNGPVQLNPIFFSVADGLKEICEEFEFLSYLQQQKVEQQKQWQQQAPSNQQMPVMTPSRSVATGT
jgi:hypothetical protein